MNVFVPVQAENQTPSTIRSRLNLISGDHDWYEDALSRLASCSHDAQRAPALGRVDPRIVGEDSELVARDDDFDVPSQPATVGRLSDVDIQILQLKGAFELPPRSIRASLNDIFMERCYPWMPIIERSWLEDGAGHRVSSLLVQAVFLAASRVSSSPTVAAFASPREFYQRAKTLFWTGHEQDALMTIRAACILNWYIPHGPEQVSFDTGRFWTQVAVGLAHQIGLHKEPPAGKANFMRRRLWWSLVVCFYPQRDKGTED